MQDAAQIDNYIILGDNFGGPSMFPTWICRPAQRDVWLWAARARRQ